MHHSLWITILQHVVMCKAGDVVWNYGKQLVQAVALYILVVRFVAVFVSSYVSQPRSAISGRVAELA
jgi:hypothetical protein